MLVAHCLLIWGFARTNIFFMGAWGMNRFFLFLFSLTTALSAGVPIESRVKGFTLTEIGTHRYDANLNSGAKTEAQYIVDRLFNLGFRHITLSPRAIMRDPRNSYVEFYTPEFELLDETNRYLRLIDYIHSRGMTVGIRPILFVIDQFGGTPYFEPIGNGEYKVWWHGNIQPVDPTAWFASFQTYLENYAKIARLGVVEEFTIGAELQSMTVGIGDEWVEYPNGFASKWASLARHFRTLLPSKTRIMYDINYTDAGFSVGEKNYVGGELAYFRYYLVDNYQPADPMWKGLQEFWGTLDAVGIDLYRSLAQENQVLPSGFNELVSTLKATSDTFVLDLENTFSAIDHITGVQSTLEIKEAGFRSVQKSFINPFVYAGSGILSLDDQAAAYAAFFQSFFTPTFTRLRGVGFWDASVDTVRHGASDYGFSPIGKEPTENIIRQYLPQW